MPGAYYLCLRDCREIFEAVPGLCLGEQQPAEPNRRRWGYYGYGLPTYPGYPTYPVLPHPKPPAHLPEPHKPVAPRRPKTLDSPLYNRSTSPVYR